MRARGSIQLGLNTTLNPGLTPCVRARVKGAAEVYPNKLHTVQRWYRKVVGVTGAK